MQGRLLNKLNNRFQAHPLGYWMDEFPIASKMGFNCIEFILDYYEYAKNPLMHESGLNEIKKVISENNVLVKSVCADFFMESPIFLEKKELKKKNIDVFTQLVTNCFKLGVKYIVIPFVDKSSIKNDKRKYSVSVEMLKLFCEQAKKYNIEICLETDLEPRDFLRFIEQIGFNNLSINYDTGNSVSLGYDFKEEFSIYSEYVTNIHLKDRILGGGSVYLGKGNMNFEAFFDLLKKMKYKNMFIMQAYRENDGIASLKPQLNYIKSIIKTHFIN